MLNNIQKRNKNISDASKSIASLKPNKMLTIGLLITGVSFLIIMVIFLAIPEENMEPFYAPMGMASIAFLSGIFLACIGFIRRIIYKQSDDALEDLADSIKNFD